jgi:hypothetical protein
VDAAVRELLMRAESRATEVVRTRRAALERLIGKLEREETLYREQIEETLEAPFAAREQAPVTRFESPLMHRNSRTPGPPTPLLRTAQASLGLGWSFARKSGHHHVRIHDSPP